MKKYRSRLFSTILTFLLIFFDIMTIVQLKEEAFYRSDPDTELIFTEFRRMNFMEGYNNSRNWNSYCMDLLGRQYHQMNLTEGNQKLKKYHPDFFEKYEGYLEQIYSDLEYFPVAESQNSEDKVVSFVNSWMDARTFGGSRGHEGCDIMAEINQRGLYPVVSATAGTVEKIGWLTQGGYRIGIKGTSGAYFYYAHLSEYAKDFVVGEPVEAGQLLGFMGDSGYGEEGTIGMFDVHLHFGIYLYNESGEEFSVNPYYVLKYLEKRKRSYDF